MKPNPLPPIEEVRKRLNYNPVTGLFTWASRKNSLSRIQVGDTAGSVKSDGYIRIKLNGIEYSAHRLAWLLMTGEEPDKTVDHINYERADNRWINLRLATSHQQQTHRNIKGWVKAKYGKNKYVAHIKINGKKIVLGRMPNADMAHCLYLMIANYVWGEYASKNFQTFYDQLSEEQQTELRTAAANAKVKLQGVFPEAAEGKLQTAASPA